jgi:hypothetical protein
LKRYVSIDLNNRYDGVGIHLRAIKINHFFQKKKFCFLNENVF